MATSKTKSNTSANITELNKELTKINQELQATRLDIKAGVQSNTNAHKPLKRKKAQLVYQIHQLTKQAKK